MANTEPYPIRWSTVHFGLDVDSIQGDSYSFFRDQMLTVGALVFIEGDGWQEWNAAPGTGANDTTTMHVQIAAQTKAGTADVIAALRASALPLVARVRADASGNTERMALVVTPSDDQSETLYSESLD